MTLGEKLYIQFFQDHIIVTTLHLRNVKQILRQLIEPIKYSSSNGNGLYGFLYTIDEYGNHELMQHGEDITIDNLIK